MTKTPPWEIDKTKFCGDLYVQWSGHQKNELFCFHARSSDWFYPTSEEVSKEEFDKQFNELKSELWQHIQDQLVDSSFSLS